MPGPSGFDVALIQAQLVCLVVSFALVMATMVRGSAFHDDGWHLVRAFGRRVELRAQQSAARRARPPARGKALRASRTPPPGTARAAHDYCAHL
jgi:hypothetical protein